MSRANWRSVHHEALRLGSLLDEFRKAKDYPAAKLAEEIGVPRSTFYAYLSDKLSIPASVFVASLDKLGMQVTVSNCVIKEIASDSERADIR